ncbi:MAG TPA: hypothetical protein VML96_08400, partial [Egibacteraceae bacterium]|nr:hypothetical protein [Egibacteraceae bacterium]
MARYMDTDLAEARTVTAGATPNLIRWGAVFGGVVMGLSLLLLLTALWIAMAYAGGIEAMQDNLAWWTAGSAVVAMFVGGMLAGW